MTTGEMKAMPEAAGQPGAATGREFERFWSSEVIVDLCGFGLIAVEGPDAKTFLASLFTGDVRLVSPYQGQFTSWCDAKGRIVTTFWLFMRQEVYYLLLPQSLLPATLTRLRQFLLRSKAAISDASGNLTCVGISGSGVAARLAQILGGDLPVLRGEVRGFGECALMTLTEAPQPRWLLVGPESAIAPIRCALQSDPAVGDGKIWSLFDILSGLPWLAPETSAEFVPQMLNLEALGGLCFTKGCYPGQEVVARLHYRGQLKRRLYLAYLDGEQAPEPGTRLAGPGTEESVGMVLSATATGIGRIALLAVVVIDQKEAGDIHLLDLTGPKLEFDEPFAAIAIDP